MRRKLVRLEVVAWCTGLLCLIALLVFRVQAGQAEQAASHVGQPSLTQRGQESASGKEKAPEDLSTYTGIIGRLEIPAIGLRVPILNDYDPNSLRQGVGRMKGTAVPGGLGNFVVAGHRDTYFRPLRRISVGMTMHIVSKDGNYDYVVDATSIVLPEDVDVLDIGDRPEMTLITCYPFEFVGAAPKRFIVRGHLVSVGG